MHEGSIGSRMSRLALGVACLSVLVGGMALPSGAAAVGWSGGFDGSVVELLLQGPAGWGVLWGMYGPESDPNGGATSSSDQYGPEIDPNGGDEVISVFGPYGPEFHPLGEDEADGEDGGAGSAATSAAGTSENGIEW